MEWVVVLILLAGIATFFGARRYGLPKALAGTAVVLLPLLVRLLLGSLGAEDDLALAGMVVAFAVTFVLLRRYFAPTTP